MALRDWPARRIGFLWLVGIILYAGLFLIGIVRQREWQKGMRDGFGSTGNVNVAADTISVEKQDSLFAFLFAVLRETKRGSQAHRDSVRRELHVVAAGTPLSAARRDSLYRALNVPARLNASQRDSLWSTAESLFAPVFRSMTAAAGKATSGMGPSLVIVAVMFLAPGVALIAVTILWVYSRRRQTSASDVAAA